MIISDLNYLLEVSAEDTVIGGGYGYYKPYYYGSQNFADASASASASGGYFNAADTSTYTKTSAGYYPYASSSSSSHAVSVR